MDKKQLSTNVQKATIQIKKDITRSETLRKRSRPSTIRPKSHMSTSNVKDHRTIQETVISKDLKNPSEPSRGRIELLDLRINLKPDPVCVLRKTIDNTSKTRKTSNLSQCISATVHSKARRELPTRKKSGSCIDLLLYKQSIEQFKKSVSGSMTSRSLTTTFIRKEAVNEFHKPGTIPSYLNRAKAYSLKIELKKRQNAFDDKKKAFSEMHRTVLETYEDLVHCREKVKNSVVREMVLDKKELLPKGVRKLGNGDILENNIMTEKNQYLEYEQLERAYENLLRFETDLKNMNDTNRSNVNNLLQNLTEHIADMKVQQEMALMNCQTDLLYAIFNSGRLKSDQQYASNNGAINVQEILQLSDNKELLRTKLLSSEHQNKILKIMHIDTEKTLDMSQKEVILLRERLNEFINLSDKYKQLEIQHEKDELKITAMAIQIRDANLIANKLSNDLKVSNEQLVQSAHQCHQLKDHVFVLAKKNKELNTIIKSNRNTNFDLNKQKDFEINEEEISVALSSEIDKHRCIITQLKEEIFELVQKRQGHLAQLNETEHQKIVKSLELNLVKYDRRLHQSYADNHKLKHRLHQEAQHQIESEAEIAKLKCADKEKQHELESLRSQLLKAEDRIINFVNGYCISELEE